MTRAIVIGQSHAVAIEQALAGGCSGAEAVTVYRVGSRTRPAEQDTITDEESIALLRELPADTPLFLSLLGTYHNLVGLLRSGPEFDFLLGPADVPDSDSGTRIPHRAIAAMFEGHLAAYPGIAKMRAATAAPMFLLSTPPPKQSSDFMLNRFMRQNKMIRYGKRVDEVGIERPETRLKLWSMEMCITARWARSQGVEFVSAPPKCFNADGFLARKYYFDDATHANALYGALVVEQICAITESMRQESAHG